MIDTIKNSDGYIVSYIEWEIVDSNGKFKTGGEYVYIQNIWIHENFKNVGLIGKMSEKIYEHPYSHKAKWVYWQIVRDIEGNKIIDEEERSYKSKRMSKIFEKEYIFKKVKLKGEQ